jgi:hypothetical protein
MLARNAACVLLNTAINASTMSAINTTTTRISTSVKARSRLRVVRLEIVGDDVLVAPEPGEGGRSPCLSPGSSLVASAPTEAKA